MKHYIFMTILVLPMISLLLAVQPVFGQEVNKKTMFTIKTAQPIVLSGYTHVRFQSREDKIDGFDIRRARLGLKGKFGERISYKLQTEFGGSRQKLLDAELSYKVSGFLTIYAGQFKIPFSLENLTSSNALATISRSQVVEGLSARSKDVLGNQSGRDIGIKLNGKYRWLDFTVGVFNGSGINTVDLNEDKDVIGRLVLHPLQSLGIGFSYYTGRMTQSGNSDSVDRNRIGAEISWSMTGAALIAEYIWGTDDVIEKSGWYVQVEYKLMADQLYGVLKYDVFDADLDRINSTTSVITAGCTVELDNRCKVQINYEFKSEDVEISNNAVFAQVQYAF